ncbi:MAG TPA: helix-turn-helix transcriptional regulator [Ktedonobacteraceae bacterium]|nr:helix-turn-helix transcriptional regulator [Ktedonobacteraceae bacterium]
MEGEQTSNRIKAEIKRRGYRLYEVAKALYISERTLYNYCTGETPIPRITLERLAKLLECPISALVDNAEADGQADTLQLSTLPGKGTRMFSETLDVAEELISQVWSLRRAAHITDAEKSVRRLNALFTYFHEQLAPPLHLDQRFRLLDIQVQRLNAATALENKRYDEAITIYTQELQEAKSLDNPAVSALALKGLGKELERKGRIQEAVMLLEDARDYSLRASKPLIAFVHSYLSRVYASAGDALRFERAIQTGLTVAHSFKGQYEDGTDFVYSWSPISALLAEQSWGYLSLGEPRKTLAMRNDLECAILEGQDYRVYAWIPLDWARAYLMLGDVEAGIACARLFLSRVTAMKSPHATNQAFKYVKELEQAGYGDVAAVREFREELYTAQAQQRRMQKS